MTDKRGANLDGIESEMEAAERQREIDAYNRWRYGAQLMLVMAILFMITAMLFWIAIQP